jgi:hypothetical protein
MSIRAQAISLAVCATGGLPCRRVRIEWHIGSTGRRHVSRQRWPYPRDSGGGGQLPGRRY